MEITFINIIIVIFIVIIMLLSCSQLAITLQICSCAKNVFFTFVDKFRQRH